MQKMKESCTFTMFIYTSDLTFRSMTNWIISTVNYRHLLGGVGWICKNQHGCRCHMHAPTWPFCRARVNASCHPVAHSGGRTVWLFPQSPWKKGRVTDRKNVPGHHGSALHSPQPPPSNPKPKTSTHWTHQVISWGLKYLLGKYLPWLSDPTS